jgi:hypothetical protein
MAITLGPWSTPPGTPTSDQQDLGLDPGDDRSPRPALMWSVLGQQRILQHGRRPMVMGDSVDDVDVCADLATPAL